MATRDTSPARGTGYCEHGNDPTTCAACQEDAAKADKEKDVEEIEKFRDARIEFLLNQHAEYLNEGNNGAVFKINVNEMPPDLKAALKDIGLTENKEGERAVKILKVYSAGQGRKEYDMHKRAYEIASMKKGDPKYAQVPEPQIYRDLPISKETAEKMKHSAKNFRATERVEVLIMDYVPGKDVATLLYQEVLKGHPRANLRKSVDRMSFDELLSETRATLGFETPGGKARDEGQRNNEIYRVEAGNKMKMMKYLRDDAKVQVNPSIVEQMKNTIRLFHENGLTIRDGHHRNFMVSGDFTVEPGKEPAETPQAFIIDFENTVSMPKGLTETEIHDRYLKTADTLEGKNYHDPLIPARDLEMLTTSREERLFQEKMGTALKLEKELSSLRKRIEAKLEKQPNAALDGYERELEAAMLEGGSGADKLYSLLTVNPLARGTSQDVKTDMFLIAAQRVAERSPDAAEKMAEALEKLQKKIPISEWNKVLDFIKLQKKERR